MEHLCEPEHDLMDDVDARYIIEGRSWSLRYEGCFS